MKKMGRWIQILCLSVYSQVEPTLLRNQTSDNLIENKQTNKQMMGTVCDRLMNQNAHVSFN